MSKRRLQVILTEEAWTVVESVTKEANAGFELGTINYSDAINELILAAKVDIKLLQSKHTNIRRSLRFMASKGDVDLDDVIRTLTELKARTAGSKKQKREATVDG